MNVKKLLLNAGATHGDPGRLAIVTAEFVLEAAIPNGSEDLRSALDAVTVLSWFDESRLAKMLSDMLAPRSTALFEALVVLPFVERFPARGTTAYNVHDATRLPWRRRLHAEQPDRFRELNQRAVLAVVPAPGTSLTPVQQVETLYHQVAYLPSEAAAQACEALGRGWRTAGHLEALQALAQILTELDESGLVSGPLSVAVLLELAETRWAYQPLETTASLVERAIALADELGDDRRLARALALRALVMTKRGDVRTALATLQDAVKLRRTWILQHGQDRQALGELAETLVELGRVQATLAANSAQETFESAREILHDLAVPEARNTWAPALATAWNGLGLIWQERRDFDKALDAFERQRLIVEQLADAEPDNSERQRDVASTWATIGHLARDRNDLAAAMDAFQRDRGITEALVAMDPTNYEWQRELAVSRVNVGHVMRSQGRITDALEMYESAHELMLRLVDADSTDVIRQRDLRVIWTAIGLTRQADRNWVGAMHAFEQASEIASHLVQMETANTEWQRDLYVVLLTIGDAWRAQGVVREAMRAYAHARTVVEGLIRIDPDHPQWQRDLDRVTGQMDALRDADRR